MLGHQTGAQKYRRNQAAVRLRRREKKESTGWGSRDGRGRRSWRMRERGEERGGGIKEEFCMSDYLERRRPFVTSRTLLPSKNHSTGAPLSVDCVEIFVAISRAGDEDEGGSDLYRSEVQNSRAYRERRRCGIFRLVKVFAWLLAYSRFCLNVF